MTKILLTNGDSWTYGSEIACPEILVIPGEQGYGMANRYKKGMFDTFPINDYYRIPRIWPTHLSKLLDMKDVNISWPARCNDNICDATIGWVLKFLNDGGDPKDLLVVIGWSSPERKRILVEDLNDDVYMYTFWPFMSTEDQYYDMHAAKQYFKFYVQHLWFEREFLARYVEQNFTLHTFLSSRGIKHKFFNAFYLYAHDPIPVFEWKDVDLAEIISSWKTPKKKLKGYYEQTWQSDDMADCTLNQWNSIPEDVFLWKNTLRSFKSYIDTSIPNHSDRMINMHPAPDGHEVWAKYLATIL